MKRKFYILSLVVAAAATVFSTSSCVKDLDAYPHNEDDYSSETAYGDKYESYIAGLAHCYRSFNNCMDLQVDDQGSSELVRAYFNIQEVSADGCKSAAVADSWVLDMDKNTWTADNNAASYAIYCRCINGISFVNEYLRQTTDDRLERRGCDKDLVGKVHELRCEARFIRAYLYYILIDVFGDVPFITEESDFGAVSPKMETRTNVFNYIESELKDLVSAESPMQEARTSYPRVDKGSAWGLLSRLYLNAQVLTSTVDASGKVTSKGAARWEDCKKACEEVFKSGYALCSNYSDMFRGDNGENPDVTQEFLFAVDYDELAMNSWGGTAYFSEGCFQLKDDVDENGKPLYSLGLADGWASIRMPYEYARDYFGVTIPADGYNADGSYTGKYNYTDKRAACFFIRGHYEQMTDLSEFGRGWSFYKYNNIPHNVSREDFASTAARYYGWMAKCGIDAPMIRLGEIYLTYAEACIESGAAAKGLPYLNAIRQRAGLEALSSYTLKDVQKERAAELAWESLRRSDLIRWGLYNTSDYLWKWKGGSYDGQAFPEYKLVFDFPPSELTANENLSHKPGYVE